MESNNYIFKTKINKIYIINGLGRSGNHLFISWLLSSFNKNEVFYLNNIKITNYRLTEKNIDLKTIKKKCIGARDNNIGQKFDSNISKNLRSYADHIKFLYGKLKKISVLIFSMENKKCETLSIISKLFVHGIHKYKIIVIRDFLNLIASRMKSEQKIQKNIHLMTDFVTFNYWIDNYICSKNEKDVITYNYNLFISSESFKKKLAQKLDLNYKKTKITINKFGITQGSSFETKNMEQIKDYLTRWKILKEDPFIMQIINNKKLIRILIKDFNMQDYIL